VLLLALASQRLLLGFGLVLVVHFQSRDLADQLLAGRRCSVKNLLTFLARRGQLGLEGAYELVADAGRLLLGLVDSLHRLAR